MTVAVLGVGSSAFGRQPNTSGEELAWTAVAEALQDAGSGHIDSVYVGSVYGSMGVAQRALRPFGLDGVPIIRVENACASGTTAVHEGISALESGRAGRVLALGLDHMTSLFNGPLPTEENDPHGRAGLVLPALYAMTATRYLERGLVTEDQLVAVAVKNRTNATLNPRALADRAVTADEVRSSRMIATPFTRLQCSGVADGAAAVVLGSSDGGADHVKVLASHLISGGHWGSESPHPWGFQIVRDCARVVYERAGLGPSDIDVVECHDAFTIGEIETLEALGFADVGSGGELTASGETAIDGKRPTNPSGGLIGRGHPLGATGVAQVVEVVEQLRRTAEGRQVLDPQVGLVETMGGGVSGLDGNACVVMVMSR